MHFVLLPLHAACVTVTQGAAMDTGEEEEEDLVPEITKAHFEEAMKFARR